MGRLRPYLEKGRLEAGCDEAGRGCLAGPVFAAAVILPLGFRCPGLNDSKQLTREEREEFRPIIEKQSIAWAVAKIDAPVIDRINILRASIQAMHNALKALSVRPDFILIDGNRFYPFEDICHECVIQGDGYYRSIAAASVLAKTHRDEYMRNMHEIYPHYGWEHNKGYGTEFHREKMTAHGLTPEHRRSFRTEEIQQLELFGEVLEMEVQETL
jgi:ribonuclease HII